MGKKLQDEVEEERTRGVGLGKKEGKEKKKKVTNKSSMCRRFSRANRSRECRRKKQVSVRCV